MNITQLYRKLLDDFKWKEFPKKLAVKTEYKFTEFTDSIRTFFATASVQVTMAQTTGLFDRIKECLVGIKETSPGLSIRG